jgi:hypothetical protein
MDEELLDSLLSLLADIIAEWVRADVIEQSHTISRAFPPPILDARNKTVVIQLAVAHFAQRRQ